MGLLSMIFRFACRPALFLALAVVPGLAQAEATVTVNACLEGGGRTITLTAPGLAEFRGGFSARVVIGGVTNVLSSASGTLVGSTSYTAETTPYGQANGSSSTIHFEKEQIELLFRLDQIPGVPVVMLQAGIRNRGDRPVRLLTVSPLAIDERLTNGGFEVAGSPEKWVVTGLNNATPVVTTLDILKANFFIPRRGSMSFAHGLAPEVSLELFEYGGCYRDDGVGFLFGPVGTPVAFVAAFFRPLGQGKSGLTLMADMSSVQVRPGQTRWGQQVALFFEKPDAALARWGAWVASTHGSRTAQGALSGWSSWYFLMKKVTGQDVLAVVTQAAQSGGRLRPDVIQIDRGYEREEYSASLDTNDRFPEGMPFYAGKIVATGARSGLKVQYPRQASAALVAGNASQVMGMGYSYLKLGHLILADDLPQRMTSLERYRDCYAHVRKAVGDSPYLLLNDWTQARAGLGFVDACRSGYEAERIGVRSIIEEALRAYHLNGRWFAVDNDAYYMATELKDVSPVVGGWPLARTWISMVGLSCGAAFTSDPWNEDRFKPYWRNVEVLTPPAKERTEVLDLCTGTEWPRLVGHVNREWGNWTVALLWNPAEKEQAVTLDFARIGLDPKKRYAAWSFWDNRYVGVVEGSYTTPSLAASASQHLSFTELPQDLYKPVLIGSGLHIYCGAAELKRVTSLHSAMQIELTDAGARAGDLFIYSQLKPVVKDATGFVVDGLTSAGENVWKLSLKERKSGEIQRVELGIPQPVTRQAWFWLLIVLLAASLVYSGWRYVVWQRSQLALSRLEQTTARQQERARIARDLHDELGASLAQIAMLGSMAQKVSSGDSLQKGQLAEINIRARESTRRLDEIVWAVNPARDTLEHLVSYLFKFAEEYLALAGVSFRTDIPDELPAVPLASGIRHNIFLAAREAIHNAVRHGHPATVTLKVAVEAACFTVEIEDDGVGFDVASALAGNRGLANMCERLAQVGGEARFTSAPGAGSSIVFVVPLTGGNERVSQGRTGRGNAT
jgi:signal transduction histidine kinase